MRIGLVLDHFDPTRGGVEQWTWQLANRLLNFRHEVHVVASDFGPLYQGLARSSSWTDLHPEGPAIVRHKLPGIRSRVGRAQAAAECLCQLKLDIIHDMGLGWYCDVFQPHGGARQAAFEQNLLLIPRSLRGWKRLVARTLPRYRDFDRLTSRQYSGTQVVLALSQMVSRQLQHFHGVSGERIRLVYNGVDIEKFSPDHRTTHREPIRRRMHLGDEVLFLIVAHNLKLKGVPTFLRALALLVNAGHSVHAAVVGGTRIRPYQRLASRLGITKHVSFLGAVADTVPFYAAADVYVQPTYYDPCSLVALEAFASGLPVITTQYNGAGELMTEGYHGFLLEKPDDFETLANRMYQFLNVGYRKQMSSAVRELALRHSFEHNVEQVLSVYQEVLEANWGNTRRASFAA